MTGETLWRAAAAPQLHWGASSAPKSVHFDDIYFSEVSGLDESRFIFQQGNQLAQRWQQHPSARFTIAETGFGTGLNFLSCWQLWRQLRSPQAVLHYISVERYPLRRADLLRAVSAWPELAELATELTRNYPPPLPGQQRLLLDQGRVVLDLVFTDVIESLQELASDQAVQVDAWFLDGFTPARNPDMWVPRLFTLMSQLSAPLATFATFTAASAVRRGLSEAGFTITRGPGYGGKREMLRGIMADDAGALATSSTSPRRVELEPLRYTPWHRAPKTGLQQQHAMIIGAGLAGSTTAAALARRGWRVTVMEQGSLAGAASGNLQGALYTRLSHRPSELSRFSLHSYQYSIRLYQTLLREKRLHTGVDGELCGVLHQRDPLGHDDPLRETLDSLPEVARYVDDATASQLSGLSYCSGGLFFEEAGWMNPAAVCRAVLEDGLNSGAIELRQQQGPLHIQHDEGLWHACDPSQSVLASAPITIVAAGTATAVLADIDWLPLQSIRGQVTHLDAKTLQPLHTVVCHEGYIAPAMQGLHCVGASFNLQDTDTTLRSGDQQQNLIKLNRALPALGTPSLHETPLQGRVGFRCASPDYLPMVGPAPDRAAFLNTFQWMRKNGRRITADEGGYQPGLYINTAHGSRGLTSTPLSAELLASQICGEPAPLETQLIRALSPARFLVRDLIRNRI